ncbi:tryptophan 7-halogenase [Shewanella sp. 1_MG-2023]|uniref:tryptophan halogenase family protein n=1 Tax=unclassified Shewanella TaxID=196818 RepID=UPI0026E387E2|nr:MULTISPECIES: tryptophan halogenase family protein [unclassified Shewanella]MDO6612298.1 tryptophan 7-halogenase [Shewanella sp. 7_MG-2023]MDO6772152.1 tryptophan 7-halogenase [Shewanella sp. 2_MG-2023]MDO6794058.1 tryptophan 7-halogenase [Shewanella sp. 1_MG-2023]
MTNKNENHPIGNKVVSQIDSKKLTENIVIVGGGTAGWITAGTLAAKLTSQHVKNFSVTLVESSNIPPIGVGEGTWPTMRRTLKNMGIKETDFIRECNVSFKQGAKFAKWVTGKHDDYYYHPLMLPEGSIKDNLASHWLSIQFPYNENPKNQYSFSMCLSPQEAICEAGLAPKLITTAEYDAIANYAYHLDAGLFSEFLKQHCIKVLNVKHVVDDVMAVTNNDDGDIACVSTAEHGDLSGDLFIDCSGFKSLLLGEHYQVGFKSCKDVLFVDNAIAVQVPYSEENSPIASHTISTAQTAGWIWDIGLSSRRGVGHVYSSRYISEHAAIEELKQYLSATVNDVEQLTFRKIPINPGYREKFWHRNCVAIGLSAGFLEPLEASALLLVEISANMIAEQLPANRQCMEIVSERFNQTFTYRWERIIDFLKLHYMLSQRQDSDFWRDNRKPESIPNSLKSLLSLWQYQPPSDNDFIHATEVFPAASYQYVLYGMGFKTASSHWGYSTEASEKAYEKFKQVNLQTSQFKANLMSNRELINSIKQYGLQRV